MPVVRATAQGYFEGFREVGAEFTVPDDLPPSPWWTPVEAPVPAESTPKPRAKKVQAPAEEA